MNKIGNQLKEGRQSNLLNHPPFLIRQATLEISLLRMADLRSSRMLSENNYIGLPIKRTMMQLRRFGNARPWAAPVN